MKSAGGVRVRVGRELGRRQPQRRWPSVSPSGGAEQGELWWWWWWRRRRPRRSARGAARLRRRDAAALRPADEDRLFDAIAGPVRGARPIMISFVDLLNS